MTQLFDFYEKNRIYYLIQPLTLLLIRAVALQRADWEGLSDEGCIRGLHGFNPGAKAGYCDYDPQN
jgi:hypothetical protein